MTLFVNTLKYLFIFILIFTILVVFMFKMQESFIFFPEKLDKSFKFSFEQEFEEYFLEPDNDVLINGLLFKTKSAIPKGVILYFHGNAGSLKSWGGVSDDFLQLGYDVFIIDYRTFGKSRGKLSEKALHLDAEFAYNWLKEKYSEESIIIYGRSIGSAMAVKLAAKTNPHLLILEAPFYNMTEIAQKLFPFLPVNLLLNYKFENNKWITNVNVDVYIFHGTDDEVIPVESGKKLFELLNNKGEFIAIPGGMHNDLILFKEYKNKLAEILY